MLEAPAEKSLTALERKLLRKFNWLVNSLQK
jgi:hypothetical protein